MVKQFFKKKSKRVSTKTRTKIEKKVRQHNKKAKRAAKKNPQKKSKKDPGVPNSYPFKEQILQEAEEHKRRLEEERLKQKEKRKKERQKLMDKKRNLSSLVTDAQKRTQEFDRKKAFVKEQSETFTGGKAVESSLKAYYKEFKKVIDAADVILEVLDARDPLGSRCTQMEEAVLSSGATKKLVLLLNKIDLVPKENVEAWLKYLRKELPTVAFKASTQTQKDNLSHSKVLLGKASEELRKSSCCLGASVLMKLLGNYCRNQNIKTTIRVGVVGFPNTGKSSIINSLKRSKACHVGAMPGVTKAMQEVQLDKHIKLLDCPGIVMALAGSDEQAILRNCVKLESLDDPIAPVAVILKRCSKEKMMLHYNIADYADVNEFVALLARRQGRLKKHGVPDVNRAAKMMLQDWNMGKITFYTEPPEEHTAASHLSAEIVTQLGKEFDIDAVLNDEQETLKDLRVKSVTDMVVDSLGPVPAQLDSDSDMEEEDEEEDEEAESEDDEMETEEKDTAVETALKKTTVVMPTESRSRRTSCSNMNEKSVKSQQQADLAKHGLMQLNKERKKDFKKMLKNRKRADVVAGQLSNALTDAFGGFGAAGDAEDYDFSTDFR
ncbi:Guanine nucleotide-binding protein-like 3 [Lamellibrachia satsuma]|nr:Guanine nucleotide-binding protein-like 3 [Lamellibrachia satsuma]